MSGAGLPTEVFIAKIKSSSSNFDTAPTALKSLKAAGVPDKVILAMVEAPAGQHRPSAPSPVSTPVAASAPPLPSTSVPSDDKTRVLVTDSQSWEARGYSSAGGNKNGWGASSSYASGARPQTAEIIKTLNERCPQLVVTNRLDKADFVITLDHEGGKAVVASQQNHGIQQRWRRDLQQIEISLGNSVKDACQVMSDAKR